MKTLLRLLPLIFGLVKIAEEQVPMSGKGKEKLDFVLDAAGAVFEAEEELRASWKDKPAFIASAGKATNTAVALLNAAGVFKHEGGAQ